MARSTSHLLHTFGARSLRGTDDNVASGAQGFDGHDAAQGILYAIYCPEKPETADYRRKALSDLGKAARLATEQGYSITRWIFVTPNPLREQLQAKIRAIAASLGLHAGFLADTHLEDLLRKHPHIRDEMPTLEYPQIARQLETIRAPLIPFRVFFALECSLPLADFVQGVSQADRTA